MDKLFILAINLSISAGYLVVAVLLLRPLLARAPKWMIIALWGLVALRLLFPLPIESPWSLLPSEYTVPGDIATMENPGIYSGLPALDSVLNTLLPDSPIQLLSHVGTAIWLTGTALMLLYALVSYLRLRRRLRTAVLLRRNIYQCGFISSPFVLGIFRPKIYIPLHTDEDSLPYVINHEDSHIDRRDHWWKPLGFLLLSIYWFNPLLWIAYSLLCRDIELACDERAIAYQDTRYRADYSRALLSCSGNTAAISACPLAFGEVGVKQRIRSVLRYRRPNFLLVALAVLACLGAAVGFMTTPQSPDTRSLSQTEMKQSFLDIEPWQVAQLTVCYEDLGTDYTKELSGRALKEALTLLQQLPDQPVNKETDPDFDGSYNVWKSFGFRIRLHSGAVYHVNSNGHGQLLLGKYFFTTGSIPDWAEILGPPDYERIARERIENLAENGISTATVGIKQDGTDYTVALSEEAQQLLLQDLQTALENGGFLEQGQAEQNTPGVVRFWISPRKGTGFTVTVGSRLWIGDTAFTLKAGLFTDWLPAVGDWLHKAEAAAKHNLQQLENVSGAELVVSDGQAPVLLSREKMQQLLPLLKALPQTYLPKPPQEADGRVFTLLLMGSRPMKLVIYEGYMFIDNFCFSTAEDGPCRQALEALAGMV